MKEIRRGSYKIHKSIKNKNLDFSILLQRMFNFEYAGKCVIFIQKRYNKYELVHQGVHIVGDVYTFSENHLHRYQFDSLYRAILAFNLSVRIITSTMDWYKPEYFSPDAIYDEIFIQD